MANNFWLTDEQFAALAPHLPMVHTGPERQDDRRIISGIIHRGSRTFRVKTVVLGAAMLKIAYAADGTSRSA